jgi:hypothetical protein
MVRTAVAAGDLTLAERLATGLGPTFAYHRHALCAAGAVLAEARGRLAEADALLGRAGTRA